MNFILYFNKSELMGWWYEMGVRGCYLSITLLSLTGVDHFSFWSIFCIWCFCNYFFFNNFV